MNGDGLLFVLVRYTTTTGRQSRLGVRTIWFGINEVALGSRTLGGRQDVSVQGQGTGFSDAFIIGICEVNGNRWPGARLDRDRTKLRRWQTFPSSPDLRY